MIRKAIIVVLVVLSAAWLWLGIAVSFGNTCWAARDDEGHLFAMVMVLDDQLMFSYYARCDEETLPWEYKRGTGKHLIWMGVHRHMTGSPWRFSAVISMHRASLFLLCLALMLYPTVAFIRGPVCRHRRRKRNHCIHCGYNLTGLPEPRCPECGAGT